MPKIQTFLLTAFALASMAQPALADSWSDWEDDSGGLGCTILTMGQGGCGASANVSESRLAPTLQRSASAKAVVVSDVKVAFEGRNTEIETTILDRQGTIHRIKTRVGSNETSIQLPVRVGTIQQVILMRARSTDAAGNTTEKTARFENLGINQDGDLLLKVAFSSDRHS